jgi:simple sugar transport system permease protein
VAGSVFGVATLGIVQSLIMFNGTVNSWWTKIAAGGMMLAFIGLQRVIVEARESWR